MNASYSTLIGARELVDQLDDPDWRIVDCRHDLADPGFGRAAYERGHLPGAHFLHLDDDLSGRMTGTNGRHPLPDPADFAARLGRIGIGNDTQVIAYDDAGGMFAARLWWMMRWLGHRRVAVLDGGLVAWCAAGQALTIKTPSVQPTTYSLSLQPAVVDAAFVLDHLYTDEILLIDARSPDRFRGENEPLDPVGGHIPGAKNRFFRDNLIGGACFKQASVLREEFGALLKGRDAHRVVHQCGSGVTACHNLLAMESAGLSGSRLYAGSWSEWCADPRRPIATGPEE
ncbi:sulfurtransferase [Aromatoleum buckelii]|uniref:Sulfurtransferase n=1 Tax=Aromatoleum buckelii TaxID=200254 RepID=A0ABX1N2I8_9RHOO|nr:sulfurtransferase [Aromatoleum buckelii]MCK0510845.1 sulfurtransferase [Aromatoleum buckelii]